MNIVATNHALDRWRERVAIYGDETIVDMRAKLAEAIALQGEIPQGISTYKVGSVVFILDTHNSLCQIVTVIDESEKIPIKQEWLDEKEKGKEELRLQRKEEKQAKRIYQPTITIPNNCDKKWLKLAYEECSIKLGEAKANVRLIEEALHKFNTNTLDSSVNAATMEEPSGKAAESESV